MQFVTIFTALHCRRKVSVCLSVCPSIKRVDCDKTEICVLIFIPYERSFNLVF